MPHKRIAALQIGSALESSQESVAKVLAFEQEIKAHDCDLVVMPEALIGGYPKGFDFGARMGYRKEPGRAQYLEYWERAVDLKSDDLKDIKALARRTSTALIVGVIEKVSTSLYCSTVFISKEGNLDGIHRKLVPTATERLVWAQGDGSTMSAFHSDELRMASAICWENHMPLLRTHMYGQDINLWCASTVDARDIWQVNMRHIAYEGRMFLVSACQFLDSPKKLGMETDWPEDEALISGGSVIISPMGEVIAGPIYGEEALISAEIDLDDVVKARYDLDVTGHYARPDIFNLTTDTTKRTQG